MIPAGADASALPIASSAGSRAWARLRRDPAFWLGGVIVLTIALAALLAPFIAPHDPDLAYRMRDGGLTDRGDPVGPTALFPLGTDLLGRDLLSRLIYGARTSLTVGILANAVATVFGAAVGAVAGFAGNPRVSFRIVGRERSLRLPVETVLMRLTDVTLALPAVLLAMALAAVIGPSLWLVAGVIAALLWTATARIVYGAVLDVKRNDFILAAQALGVSPRSILVRHVVPHLAPLVVIYATLGISASVLFESALAFLGAGVPKPTASWGSMISEHVSYYATQPRLMIMPGLAIMLTVLGFNLLGDSLRDALDPRTIDREHHAAHLD